MQWTRADSRMLLSTAALDWRYPSTHPCSVVLSHIQSWREAPQGLRVLIFYTMGENSRIKSLTEKCFVTSPPIKVSQSNNLQFCSQGCQNTVLEGRNPSGFSALPDRKQHSPRQHLGTRVKGWSTWLVRKPGWKTSALEARVLTSLL